jgi:Ca-activated chloride channel family protein
LFDVSLSMAANDITPSRFSAAKSALHDMITTLENYNISLITFSKIPFIRIPFSTDTKAISTKRTQTKLSDFPPVQEFIWTAIGDALLLWIKNLEQFNDKQMQSWIIILITDWDSHEWTPIESVIPILQKKWIPVYVFGIWEQDFTIGIDQQSNTIKARVDLTLLQKIANQTNGQFFRILEAQSFQHTMQDIVKNIKTQEKEKVIEEYFSINLIFLIILFPTLFFQIYIQIQNTRK